MPTSLRIPSQLEQRYRELAATTGRSQSFYLTQALEMSIDRLEERYRLLATLEDYQAGRLETMSLQEAKRFCGLED